MSSKEIKVPYYNGKEVTILDSFSNKLHVIDCFGREAWVHCEELVYMSDMEVASCAHCS